MRESKPDLKIENSQGFSLLETSIALVIMMVVTLGTASLYVYVTNYNAGSADRAASLAIAQQKMERLRRTNFADGDLTPGTTTENVTYSSHHYTMVTTICGTSDCGGSSVRKLITVQVTPQGSKAWMNTPITLVSERATGELGSYISY
jgi:Tfp pilus assembly protein PilV